MILYLYHYVLIINKITFLAPTKMTDSCFLYVLYLFTTVSILLMQLLLFVLMF